MASLRKVVTRSLLCSTKSLPIAAPISIGIKLKSTFTEFEEYRISAVKFRSALPNLGGKTKGQLISKCPFGGFKSSKKPTKSFPGFLPWPLLRGQIKKVV